jgi:hypothetical protein
MPPPPPPQSKAASTTFTSLTASSPNQDTYNGGETDLALMLRSLEIDLRVEEYCFVTVLDNDNAQHNDNTAYADIKSGKVLMCFMETEGLTFIMRKDAADEGLFAYTGTYRVLTLKVYSSLEAVGLTAFVSKVLADANIPANVVAAFYHDHVMVPAAEVLIQKAHALS